MSARLHIEKPDAVGSFWVVDKKGRDMFCASSYASAMTKMMELSAKRRTEQKFYTPLAMAEAPGYGRQSRVLRDWGQGRGQ